MRTAVRKFPITAIIATLSASLVAHAEIPAQIVATVSSPDKHLVVELQLNNNKPEYRVKYHNKPFLEWSSLGLNTSAGDISGNIRFSGSSQGKVNTTYQMDRAKVSEVHYEANTLTASFGDVQELQVEFQVSDNNIAFRYILDSEEKVTRVKVFSEATTFNLPDDATTLLSPQALPETGWMQTKPSYEEPYTFEEPVSTASANGAGYTFPGLFRIKDGGYLLISETGVDSKYVGSRLGESKANGVYPLAFPQQGENGGIGETFPTMATPAITPWRTITVGHDLAPIVESNISHDVVQPKYKPSQHYEPGRATWSWIVWQDDSINYDDQITYIDLAASLNFEYVLIDNWWDVNIGRARMAELVEYAATRNVGVVLWYNSNGWWNDAPQTPQDRMNTAPARRNEMAWLLSIGVKGIKVDFFGGDKQDTMRLYEDIFTDANDYGIAVTVHGSTLPRGWERMYPNFVTSEAVLASENLVFFQPSLDAHARNATILPFTRNPLASMDFAPVFLNQRLSREQNKGTTRSTTDAFELATGVLYFSPVQHFGGNAEQSQRTAGFRY